MHLVVDKKQTDMALLKDFESGIFKDTYTEKEKEFITLAMFEKAKAIAARFNKQFDFTLMINQKSRSKIIVHTNKEIVDISINTLFDFVFKTSKYNRKSYITNLMASKTKEEFESNIKLVENI